MLLAHAVSIVASEASIFGVVIRRPEAVGAGGKRRVLVVGRAVWLRTYLRPANTLDFYDKFISLSVFDQNIFVVQ